MHNHFFITLNQIFSAYPMLGIIFAFLIAFLESLAIIGSIIPGSVTLTAVGILIGTGIIPTIPTLIAAIFGAILGDTLSFYLGKRYRHALLKRWPFKHYPNLIVEGEQFFNRHGNLSIFIGRFVGPIRCILPVCAGILNMNPWHFILADLVSAIIWAPAYLLPGILIGATSIELEPDTGPRLLIILFLSLVLIWVLKIFSHYCTHYLQRQLRIFSVWIGNYFPKTYQHFYRDHRIRCRSLYLCIAFLTLIFTSFIVKSGAAESLNIKLWYLVQNFRFLDLSSLLTAITLLAEKEIILSITFTMSAFWYWKKERQLALLFLLCLCISCLFGGILKHYIAHPRPPGLVFIRPSYSFPSGHTALITATLTFLHCVLSQHLKRQAVQWLYRMSCLIIITIIFSRLYLGAHWFADIIGGFSSGLTMALFFSTFYLPNKINGQLAKQSLLAFSLISMAYLGIALKTIYPKHFISYHIKPLTINSINVDQWWEQTQPILATERLNYFGRPDVPFNLQWLAEEKKLVNILKQNGWKQHEISWLDFIDRLAHFGDKHHLPLFPKQFHFQPAALIFTKKISQNLPILVLRLWRAPLNLKDSEKELYFGTLHYRYIWHRQSKKQPYHDYPDLEKSLENILKVEAWRKINYPVSVHARHELKNPGQFYLIDFK